MYFISVAAPMIKTNLEIVFHSTYIIYSDFIRSTTVNCLNPIVFIILSFISNLEGELLFVKEYLNDFSKLK